MKILLFISTVASVISRSHSMDEKCKVQLGACLDRTPMQDHKGLPTSASELNYLCRSFTSGMECVTKWNKECLPPELRVRAERKISSVQIFMSLLCSDGEFKKEYLNHTDCFGVITRDWDRCNQYFQDNMDEINKYGNRITYIQQTIDVCCARYGFNRCISLASKARCNKSAAIFLRRISETLSYDSRCDRFQNDLCSSSKRVLPSVGAVAFFLVHLITLIVALIGY